MTDSLNTPCFIGIDVAKAEVVVATYGDNGTRSIANTTAALKAWLKALPPGSRLGLESTSNYHELLAGLAHDAGFTVYLLNPKDVRHYAQSVGTRAKTDQLDARLLARFIAREYETLHPWQPPAPVQRHLDTLLKRRATLIRARGAIRQSMEHLSSLKTEINTTFKAIDTLLDAIDREIEQTLASQPDIQAQARCLRSVPGIGLLTGAALLNLFRRLPAVRADAVVAFTGLDPRPCDSGQKRGKRRLSKRGPSELRRLLFNAAMSAAKTKLWRPYYERERAKGLPTTTALVAIARRLVRVAFALVKKQIHFNPDRIKIA
jgi:transposase